jgi:hypothetical protein
VNALVYRDVYNVVKEVRLEIMGIHYKKKPTLKEDLDELLDHLESNEDYCFEKLVSNENQAFGVAFLRKDFAALMGKHGHLIQLDATHKVNGHQWKLFNLVFRDSYGVWMPGAHILLSLETGAMIEHGLRALRRLMEPFKRDWAPRYFIVDDSAAEQDAPLVPAAVNPIVEQLTG